MSSEIKLIKDVVEMIEKYGINTAKNIVYKAKFDITENEKLEKILRCVTEAFQVSRDSIFIQKNNKRQRRTSEEVEALVYFVILADMYSGMSKKEIFNFLKFDDINIRFYYNKKMEYGLECLDTHIPRHKKIYEQYKIAEAKIINEII